MAGGDGAFWADTWPISSDWNIELYFGRIAGIFKKTKNAQGTFEEQRDWENNIKQSDFIKEKYPVFRRRLLQQINSGFFSADAGNMADSKITSSPPAAYTADTWDHDKALKLALERGDLGTPIRNIGVCMHSDGGLGSYSYTNNPGRSAPALRWRISNDTGYEILPGVDLEEGKGSVPINASHAGRVDDLNDSSVTVSRNNTIYGANHARRSNLWTTGTGKADSYQNMNFYIYDNKFKIEFPSEQTGNESDKWDGARCKITHCGKNGTHPGKPPMWLFAAPTAGLIDAALHGVGFGIA